jgi:hypothetical protein
LPRGWCAGVGELSIVTGDGLAVQMQARVLGTWSDRSPRWVLFDLLVDAPAREPCFCTVVQGESTPRAIGGGVAVSVGPEGASIDTGVARFLVVAGGELVYVVPGTPIAAPIRGGFSIAEQLGVTCPVRVDRILAEELGPIRSVVLVEAHLGQKTRSPLRLSVRYHFYKDSRAVRAQVTLRNTRRAVHAGGFWDLGDRGSMLLREMSFSVDLPPGTTDGELRCSPERRQPFRRLTQPFELYQDSSGGDNWQSSNHVNRDGRVTTRFQGYRLKADGVQTTGLRATPVVSVGTGERAISLAHRQFWERFPKAIDVRDGRVSLGLLPHQCGDVHELQGGEQITEEFVICFGEDAVSDAPLDWVRNPLVGRASTDWYCTAEAAPYLTVPHTGYDPARGSLINAAVEGPESFFCKRDRIDEYGWRNFGDLYADHETVHHQGAVPLVSHYNNQYDALAGFARQWFLTGDPRWLQLMSDLARHVIDIDVYHTDEDKAAYNRGLFWHTAHHTDAGRATHRTYSQTAGTGSGGPSAEHSYSTGLLFHYYVTGDVLARQTVLDMARWAIDMDDGRLTVFRWLCRGRTGSASATGASDYHGPGRGAGNSITTLVNAFQLTSDPAFLDKAEELIRRCSHPAEDISALHLPDAERRWSYTVFLQAIARYLEIKIERGAIDFMYAYARATLLHFARWMAANEYPFLDKPEILEFPTETWAAQDMRKSDVLFSAAKYTAGEERRLFLDRAEFFFRDSVARLSAMPTRTSTRPVVLMLTNGYARGFAQAHEAQAPPATTADFGVPSRFVPQKEIAMKRVVALGVAGAAAGLVAALAFAVF